MTFRILSRPVLIIALAFAAAGHGESWADSKKRFDQDQVHEAVKSGQIRPLEEVLAAAAKVMPGKVIKVEVERGRGKIFYELKILTGTGRVREVKIDALSLDLLEVE